MKRWPLKLAFSVVIGLLLLEALCSALAWKRYGTLDIGQLHDRETHNDYVSELHGNSFTEMVTPHPWLGITFKDDVQPPRIKDNSKFTVLLTGGSVAQMMGSWHYLEGELSSRLGKDVVVVNAACGATTQPRQAVALLLYGEVVDAVVNLDGYNECLSVGRSLDRPGAWFYEVNPATEVGVETLTAMADCKRLKKLATRSHSRAVYFLTREMRESIVSGLTPPAPDQRFDLPIPKSERRAYNINQYQKYIRSMHALAGLHGLKEAYFIQPCPAIGKVLTENEQRVVGPLDYGPNYRLMTDSLLSLDGEGIPIVSLLDVFDDQSGQIYSDAIHCVRDKDGNPGYRILATRIATELARLWGGKQEQVKQ